MTIETKKVASANEAIEIINRLNYRHDTFQYSSTTREHEDNTEIKYRHFDAYRDNGELDSFAIIEIVVNDKLAIVRFFNLFRDITVDLKLDDFTPEYSRYDEVINVKDEVETATAEANEEIINCTDDIIITEDAYTQMIHTELANAQIATGNYAIQINGEWVFFTDHKIIRIDADNKLEFSFEYTLQGRKQFRHNNRVVSRERILQIAENRDIAKTQEKHFREFFISPNAPHNGFFQVMVSPTFANNCEHDYGRYFDYFNQAIDFVNDAIKFCGDVPTHITIKRNKQGGKVYYHRTPDGTIHLDKPDTDFFKNYSADELQARIDDISRAIEDNKKLKADCVVTGCNISHANTLLAITKNFYEFVLHENSSATVSTPEFKYYIKSRRPIFGAVPNGYIKAISGEIHEPIRRTNGTYSPKCRIYFATVIYNKPLTDWQIEAYDLAVANETAEKINALTVKVKTSMSIIGEKETDGSEEDDFADDLPALVPVEDTADDELIDPPSERYYGYIGDEQVHYWHEQLVFITSSKYGASLNLHPDAAKTFGEYLIQIPDGKYVKFRHADKNEFWQIMIERGGCAINDAHPVSVEEDVTPNEMLAIVDTLDTLNAAAQNNGWHIDYDGKNFPVTLNGKIVATLDSLALAKVLPPDKFFDQFNPAISPRQRFLSDHYRELHELQAMRDELGNDSGRDKTLDELINRLKRDILDAELDDDHPPNVKYDENSDLIPWF